jgi:GntR family transcriptional repressor for pyruvate dehydrogenase complex
MGFSSKRLAWMPSLERCHTSEGAGDPPQDPAELSGGALTRGETLGDQVTAALRRRIMAGELAVGARMPSENLLARDLDVSRTVIREAVSRLKAEGFVTGRQGRSAVVLRNRPRHGFAISESDVEDIGRLSQMLDLRLAIEVEAAALAARRCTPENSTEMRAAITALRSARDRLPVAAERGADADLRFHRAIVALTQNGFFIDLFGYLAASLHRAIERGLQAAALRADDRPEVLEEHEAIAAAIEAGEAEAASAHMRRHLQNANRRLIERLTRPPVPGA